MLAHILLVFHLRHAVNTRTKPSEQLLRFHCLFVCGPTSRHPPYVAMETTQRQIDRRASVTLMDDSACHRMKKPSGTLYNRSDVNRLTSFLCLPLASSSNILSHFIFFSTSPFFLSTGYVQASSGFTHTI